MHPASVNRHPHPDTDRRRHAGPAWAALVVVGTAFGVIEAALVVHLRHFLDPSGAFFPLVEIPDALLGAERLREVATLVLLASVAALVRACGAARFATFLFVFGVWDLTYYLGLRGLMGWPQGLDQWDLLFLVPTPWFAPVYAPVVIACVMIAVGLWTWRSEQRNGCFQVRARHVAAAVLGGAVCVATFVFDAQARSLVALPARYPVEWLAVGIAIALAGYVDAWRVNRKPSS